jgi:hypothetical protein
MEIFTQAPNKKKISPLSLYIYIPLHGEICKLPKAEIQRKSPRAASGSRRQAAAAAALARQSLGVGARLTGVPSSSRVASPAPSHTRPKQSKLLFFTTSSKIRNREAFRPGPDGRRIHEGRRGDWGGREGKKRLLFHAVTAVELQVTLSQEATPVVRPCRLRLQPHPPSRRRLLSLGERPRRSLTRSVLGC